MHHPWPDPVGPRYVSTSEHSFMQRDVKVWAPPRVDLRGQYGGMKVVPHRVDLRVVGTHFPYTCNTKQDSPTAAARTQIHCTLPRRRAWMQIHCTLPRRRAWMLIHCTLPRRRAWDADPLPAAGATRAGSQNSTLVA